MEQQNLAESRPGGWWEGIFGEAPRPKRAVSLVGAGGKTTLLFTLAHELADLGYRTAVTTTTHIFFPDEAQCRRVVADGDRDRVDAALARGLVTVGVPAEGGKLASPPEEMLRHLRDRADFLLIEADGSRRMPLKVPREGEPVLFGEPDHLAAVCGLSCLGRPLDAVCQRAELARALLGVEGDHPVTPKDAARLLYSSYAGCARRVTFVLNQADSEPARELAVLAARELQSLGAGRVVAASLKTGWLRCFTA